MHIPININIPIICFFQGIWCALMGDHDFRKASISHVHQPWSLKLYQYRWTTAFTSRMSTEIVSVISRWFRQIHVINWLNGKTKIWRALNDMVKSKGYISILLLLFVGIIWWWAVGVKNRLRGQTSSTLRKPWVNWEIMRRIKEQTRMEQKVTWTKPTRKTVWFYININININIIKKY